MLIQKIGLNTGIRQVRTLAKRFMNSKIGGLMNFAGKPKTTLNCDTAEISGKILRTAKNRGLLEESQTLKILFSPKYKVAQGINKDGYYVTSIIEKNTGVPVKAYVKSEYASDYNEKWSVFVKNYTGNYQKVGERRFEIDLVRKCITPGYMDAVRGNFEYSGIGTRLHQIAIERMMQKGLKNVQVCSTESAFPFHYKCGFRVIPFKMVVEKSEFMKMLEAYSKKSGIDKITLYEAADIVKDNGKNIKYSMKSYENWRKLFDSQNIHDILDCDYPMTLSSKTLSLWKKHIELQPIFKH